MKPTQIAVFMFFYMGITSLIGSVIHHDGGLLLSIVFFFFMSLILIGIGVYLEKRDKKK